MVNALALLDTEWEEDRLGLGKADEGAGRRLTHVISQMAKKSRLGWNGNPSDRGVCLSCRLNSFPGTCDIFAQHGSSEEWISTVFRHSESLQTPCILWFREAGQPEQLLDTLSSSEDTDHNSGLART